MRIPNARALPADRSAGEIWDQPILPPIPAADNVTGTRCRQAHRQRGVIEIGAAIRVANQFRARLAAAVGIKSTKPVVLSVSPRPIEILVTLVSRHHYDRAYILR